MRWILYTTQTTMDLRWYIAKLILLYVIIYIAYMETCQYINIMYKTVRLSYLCIYKAHTM